jgi:hypothetical protein
LPAALREDKDNLFVDSKNGGHVHAPSLNRSRRRDLPNAYLTHATPETAAAVGQPVPSACAALLVGARRGQSLEVLLGYLFSAACTSGPRARSTR